MGCPIPQRAKWDKNNFKWETLFEQAFINKLCLTIPSMFNLQNQRMNEWYWAICYKLLEVYYFVLFMSSIVHEWAYKMIMKEIRHE